MITPFEVQGEDIVCRRFFDERLFLSVPPAMLAFRELSGFRTAIIHLSILNVKDLSPLKLQVCIAAQSSSSRHLPTRLNSVQTAQIKDLLPF
jgi:hypothetical protein